VNHFSAPVEYKHQVFEKLLEEIGKKIFGAAKIIKSHSFIYLSKTSISSKSELFDFQAHQFEKGKLSKYRAKSQLSKIS